LNTSGEQRGSLAKKIAENKSSGKTPRGRPRQRWQDTVENI